MKTICIMCPIGCELTITQNGADIEVEGNACVRGIDYGKKEFTKPERMVTTVVRLPNKNGTLSLKTRTAVDKKLIKDVLREIAKTPVNKKLKTGDVFIKNILATGIDIVVTGVHLET